MRPFRTENITDADIYRYTHTEQPRKNPEVYRSPRGFAPFQRRFHDGHKTHKYTRLLSKRWLKLWARRWLRRCEKTEHSSKLQLSVRLYGCAIAAAGMLGYGTRRETGGTKVVVAWWFNGGQTARRCVREPHGSQIHKEAYFVWRSVSRCVL